MLTLYSKSYITFACCNPLKVYIILNISHVVV